jgi:S-(hydroxymethyl)glutathione dehydrogenase/alcohol dehydrogenase
VKGDFGPYFKLPTVGGHEASGVVVEAGKEVTMTSVGQRVVLDPMMACGRCRWCSTGMTFLCDINASQLVGTRPDGSYRYELDGEGVGCVGQLGAFSQYVLVTEEQTVALGDDISFEVGALVGCGVQTGFGASIYGAKVQSGDVVAVVGIGGVGMSAIQGARVAGASYIFAIDPVAFKREKAMEFGATHTAASMAEAQDELRELTRGVMADKVILTMGVCRGEMFTDVNAITAKAGTVVCTAVIPADDNKLVMPLAEFFFSNKHIVGNVRGLMNSQADIPKLLHLYRSGRLQLDEMITSRYKQEEVQLGYDDMHAGKNIRGVVIM